MRRVYRFSKNSQSKNYLNVNDENNAVIDGQSAGAAEYTNLISAVR